MSPLPFLLLAAPVVADVDPHHSYDKLVSANGRAAVVLNGDNVSGPATDGGVRVQGAAGRWWCERPPTLLATEASKL